MGAGLGMPVAIFTIFTQVDIKLVQAFCNIFCILV